MAIAEKLVFKAYTALASTVATVGMHQLLNKSWKFVTGEEPPEPTDPEADGRTALLWALASAAGLALAQVTAARVGERYFGRGGKHKARKLAVKI